MSRLWTLAKRQAAADRGFAQGNADVIANPSGHTRLRRLRVRRGRTQVEVAAAAGLHVVSYAAIENGKAEPRERTQWKIARVLEVNADEIWGSERDQLDRQLREERRLLPT
jgi:transcriptional regulator with XRE-family HTH domain